VAASLRRDRRALWALIASTIIAGLWWESVRYTNGGLFYSMRVLAPLFALNALAAGIGLACLDQARFGSAAAVILAIVVAATLPATLALPRNPWSTPIAEWPTFAKTDDTSVLDEALAIIRRDAGASEQTKVSMAVLADAPGFQQRFAPAGIRV